MESLHLFGYAVLEKPEMELVGIDPRTGEEKLLMSEGRLCSFNRDYLLFMKYGEEQEELYLMDTQSLEVRFLAAYKEEEYPDSYGIRVLDMDGDSVYVAAENVKEPSGEINLYEQIDLESGERRQVLRLDIRTGVKGSLPYHAGGAVIRDGYIYYTEVMNYRMYLMRKSLEEPEENAGGEELSKSGGMPFWTLASLRWERWRAIMSRSSVRRSRILSLWNWIWSVLWWMRNMRERRRSTGFYPLIRTVS